MNEIIVVIGSGIASITAVKAIREIDKTIEIHLIGEEAFYPYNRIRLSKGLSTSLEEDKILIQKKDWYELNNINLYKNIKVTSINIDKKEVTLSNGNRINYTKLLLANGASNFIPPIVGLNKKGVLTLRTLQDAWNIRNEAEKSKEILIIGGGIQGLETAWALSQLGKKIFIAEMLPRLMPRQLDERASKILEHAIESHNIEIMLGTQIREISGDDTVKAFISNEGKSTKCDSVIYSVGIKPNIDILKGTNIKTNKGVIVNEKMKTSIEDVYAAGDVAEFNGAIYGLWNIAIEQGKTAGYNMTGKDSIYEHIVPVTTLNAFNLSLFSMGVIDEDKVSDVLVEELEINKYQKIFINKNKVVGSIVIGDIKKSPILKTAIEKEIDLSDININNVSIDELIEIIGKKPKQ